MYKFLVGFIVSILLFAFIVGQCNNEEGNYDIYDDEETPISENQQDKEVKEFPLSHETKPKELSISPNIQKEDYYPIENPTPETIENTIPRVVENPQILVDMPSQVLERKGYTLSYNNFTKNANWVAWHLTKERTDGPWSRKGIDYMEDEDIVGPKQELSDWYNHGLPIDHGHLCPAGDNKWDKDAMIQTFYLSNMCPQNSNLNRGEWERLEDRCRGWAIHYGEVYIVAGPLFNDYDYVTIGNNKVGVPNAFYKVVLRLGKRPAAIGFIFPNESPKNKMQHYVVSVDEVEDKAKIDFFNTLPDELENEIEAIADFYKW